jgi:hypothetical protein
MNAPSLKWAERMVRVFYCLRSPASPLLADPLYCHLHSKGSLSSVVYQRTTILDKVQLSGNPCQSPCY